MKEAYRYDYSGSCAPEKTTISAWNVTFSVGIFQWLPKSSKKGLKKSAVKFRIKGNSNDPEKVYSQARIICDKMNNGYQPEKKSMTVG